MHLEQGKLILGTRDCYMCLADNPGKRAGRKICSKCKGTCRGPRGGADKCPDCMKYGSDRGMVPDFANLVECEYCKGTHSIPEEITDTLPGEIWEKLDIRVYRTTAGMNWAERWLGAGVYSAVDYGKAARSSDETIIAEVRASKSHQASKVARDDGTICDHIAVIVKPDGYIVVAVFNPPAAGTAESAALVA